MPTATLSIDSRYVNVAAEIGGEEEAVRHNFCSSLYKATRERADGAPIADFIKFMSRKHREGETCCARKRVDCPCSGLRKRRLHRLSQ